jgi:DNA-binding NtrC family response regulator
MNNRLISTETLSENFKFAARDIIDLEHIDGGGNLKQIVYKVVQEVESRVIIDRLYRAKWNKTRVARELGLSREALRLKIIKYGLDRRR